MGIIKQAKNLHIVTAKKDSIIVGNLNITARKKMIFDAIENNLEFNSVKKVKADGRG